jgi:hypothetical protein
MGTTLSLEPDVRDAATTPNVALARQCPRAQLLGRRMRLKTDTRMHSQGRARARYHLTCCRVVDNGARRRQGLCAELDGDQDGMSARPGGNSPQRTTAKSTIAPLTARRQLPATDRNAVT